MSGSSLIVAVNALLLKRLDLPTARPGEGGPPPAQPPRRLRQEVEPAA